MSYFLLLLALNVADQQPKTDFVCDYVCRDMRKHKAKPKVVKVEEKTTCCNQPAPVVNVYPAVTVVVPEPVKVQDVPIQEVVHNEEWPPVFGLGLRAAAGVHSCGPYVLGIVGLRGHLFPVHLGLDLAFEFDYGASASLLFYPIQGYYGQWHINAGVLGVGKNHYSWNTVLRNLDWTIGTGVEGRLIGNLGFTADLRVSAPTLGAVQHEAYSAVVGRSVLRSQFMVGLILSTW